MGGTPQLRRLPSGAGVSGGGGVVSGGRGFGCWWWRLGCRVRRRGNSAWRSAQVQAVWFQAVARNADEVLLPAAAFRGMELRLALAQSLDAAAAVQQRAPARVQSPTQSPGATPSSDVPAWGVPTSWYGRHCREHRTRRRWRDRQIPGWPGQRFWPELPQRGRKEPAVTVSIKSLLCVARGAPRAERRRFDRLPGALAL